MSDFKPQYDQYRELVDGHLSRMFSEPALALDGQPVPENRVWDAMGHAVMAGGKRLRPILTLAVAALFDIKPSRALRAGIAIELLHSYSLVHDDLPVMDDSPLRRGKPTVHVAYDEATAVLAGDGLLTLAFNEMAAPTTHKSGDVRARLVYHLALNAGVSGMVGGQMLDMQMENQSADLPTLERLQSRKTGALIRFSAMAGAILAEQEPAILNAVRRYGEKLGLAFQMVDDLLDIESDASTLGKPAGQDAAAMKSTFIDHYGVEGTRTQVTKLLDEAKAELAFAGEKATFLKQLCDFVADRKS